MGPRPPPPERGNGSGNGSQGSQGVGRRRGRWVLRLQPVLDGSVTCTWAALNVSYEAPYLRVDGYCNLSSAGVEADSACLMTLLAYLSAEPAVMYLESYPVLSPFNAYAAAVSQSGGSLGDTPLWDAGINGTGQIVQVRSDI
jgi:hypothetical protein